MNKSRDAWRSNDPARPKKKDVDPSWFSDKFDKRHGSPKVRNKAARASESMLGTGKVEKGKLESLIDANI